MSSGASLPPLLLPGVAYYFKRDGITKVYLSDEDAIAVSQRVTLFYAVTPGVHTLSQTAASVSTASLFTDTPVAMDVVTMPTPPLIPTEIINYWKSCVLQSWIQDAAEYIRVSKEQLQQLEAQFIRNMYTSRLGGFLNDIGMQFASASTYGGAPSASLPTDVHLSTIAKEQQQLVKDIMQYTNMHSAYVKQLEGIHSMSTNCCCINPPPLKRVKM